MSTTFYATAQQSTIVNLRVLYLVFEATTYRTYVLRVGNVVSAFLKP